MRPHVRCADFNARLKNGLAGTSITDLTFTGKGLRLNAAANAPAHLVYAYMQAAKELQVRGDLPRR